MKQKFDSPQFFDIARYVCLCTGIFVSYLIGSGDATKTLHYLAFFVVVSLAGLTGIEGMFFGAASARSMGREVDPLYQKQSAGANLGLAITVIIVFAANWGRYADATILIAGLLFFIFSASIHAWDAVANKNFNKKNALRPVMTLLVVGICFWPLVWSLV
jgi:hypothetical protein